MKNFAILDAGTEVAISEYFTTLESLTESLAGDNCEFINVGEFDDDDQLIEEFELTKGVDY